MRILFIDGTAGFTPRRLEEKPCGGILTSLTLIPRYLAEQDHTVFVASVYDKPETYHKVLYIPLASDLGGLNPDVVIFNRNSISRPLAQYFKSKGARIIWWLHDIVDHRYLEDDGFKLADKIVALSKYCEWSYSNFYDIPREKFVVISNGVDPEIFYPGTKPRDKNLWLYASAPIKGVYPLEFTVRNLKRHLPNLDFRLYASQKLHDQENTQEQARMLAHVESAGARVLDPVPQKELANLFRKAYALVMPNHYPEQNSNILLQAQACALPVIASGIGSIPEFIDNERSGLYTETAPHDMYLWWKEFAELCVGLALNPAEHEKISRHSGDFVKSWAQVGGEWRDLLSVIYSPQNQSSVLGAF